MRLRKHAVRIFILLSTVFSLGCVSPGATERRQPTAVNFESLPLCARVRAMYVAKSEFNDAFVRQALVDAKAVANAAQVMSVDTTTTVKGPDGSDLTGSCAPSGIVDLIKKPDRCANWSGPYLSEVLITTYGSMTDEEFRTFLTCWTY